MMTKEAAKAASWLAGNAAGIGSTTLDRADLKSLLLETGGTLICRGHLCDIRSKHLGAGVYKVTLFDKWKEPRDAD